MAKIPKVGDEIYDNGYKFIISEVEISINPVTGSRIINTKRVIVR